MGAKGTPLTRQVVAAPPPFYKTLKPALSGGGKPYNRAFGALEMHQPGCIVFSRIR